MLEFLLICDTFMINTFVIKCYVDVIDNELHIMNSLMRTTIKRIHKYVLRSVHLIILPVKTLSHSPINIKYCLKF